MINCGVVYVCITLLEFPNSSSIFVQPWEHTCIYSGSMVWKIALVSYYFDDFYSNLFFWGVFFVYTQHKAHVHTLIHQPMCMSTFQLSR